MASLRLLLSSLPILLVVVVGPLPSLAAPVPSPDPGAGGALPAGFAVTAFLEDFSDAVEGGLPSATKWQLDLGTSYPGGPARWGNDEAETYTDAPANIRVRGGNLVITPRRGADGRWTSARVESKAPHDFACGLGQKLRVEARIRLGADPPDLQSGIWPAFWLLGSGFRADPDGWPGVGEIDVLEVPSGLSRNWQTLHCGTISGGPCRETTGLRAISAYPRQSDGSGSDGWHVLAVEIDRSRAGGTWKTETISFYVDARRTFSVSGALVGDEVAWAKVAHGDHFILLNVAVGGSLPNSVSGGGGGGAGSTPNSQTLGGDGAAMEVEYVGVYTT